MMPFETTRGFMAFTRRQRMYSLALLLVESRDSQKAIVSAEVGTPPAAMYVVSG